MAGPPADTAAEEVEVSLASIPAGAPARRGEHPPEGNTVLTLDQNSALRDACAGQDFLDRTFGLVEAMELDAYVDLYTQDGRFSFRNAPTTAEGRAAVRVGLEQFSASIAGMSHAVVATWRAAAGRRDRRGA